MSSGFNKFVELLVKGDFFLIFLIVMMLVIVSIIIYLVKMLINDRLYYEDDIYDEESLVLSEIEDEIEAINRHIYNEEKPKKLEQERFDFEHQDYASSIKSFESEQEEHAIISASELDNRIKNMKSSGEYITHEEQLQKYEAEQESKAIISYEELLKRASGGFISYESEENLDGIRVGKVDTSHIERYSETNDLPYYREEAFLESLKEFRKAL